MTEYNETEIPVGDLRNDLLNRVAEGQPWLMLVVHSEGDGIGIKAETGGGIRDAAMVKKVLKMALEAMP
jgi:hypothetical protein